MEDVLVSRLREVGLSLYEARLYLALLRAGDQNGNEVAKAAGVPSSKVYATLDKLAAEGVVRSLPHGGSTRFAAVEPGELLGRLRRHHTAPLDFLERELPKVAAVESPQPFHTVSGTRALLEAAGSIVDAARQEIQVSCWAEDLPGVVEPLAAAYERGVRVHGVLYGDGELPPGSWLRHPYEALVGERVDGRLLTLVADESEALIGRVPRNGRASALRSRSPGLTLIVQEYLRHDYALQGAQGIMGFDDWDRWWHADPQARAEILGQTLADAR